MIAFALALAVPATPIAHEVEQVCPQYETIGEGPDVLLVPGLASSPEVWDGTVDALSGSYRLHLVTVPGFAGDPVNIASDDVVGDLSASITRYVECAGLDQPALAGHSMGGFTGLIVARDNPGLLRTVVSVDSLPFYSLIFDPNATPETVRPMAEMFARQLASMDDATFAATQRRTAASLTQSPQGHETIVEWSLASDRATMVSAMTSLMTTDIRADLASIETPVIVLYAVNALFPAERAAAVYGGAYEGLPDVTLTPVEDSYHFIMWDQPEAFIDALVAAFAEPAD